jgi:uncharacterized SAM-binding protein YcdF (DUF218 family)
MKVTKAAVSSLLIAVFAWGEWESCKISRLHTREVHGKTEVILVPGYRNPGQKPNVVNRWRVKAALRSIDPGYDTTIIFSGGSPAGGVSEAELMAEYARKLGYKGTPIIEAESNSTWENITNCIPFLDTADRIKIASNPAHALKGRIYLQRIAPQLSRKLVQANDHKFGEIVLLKPFLAAFGRWTLRSFPSSELRGTHH